AKAGSLRTRAGAVPRRHAIIRAAVLDAALPHVVAGMHRRAAGALATDQPRRAAHLAAAGDRGDAAREFAAAAVATLRAHALLDAERLARRGIGLAGSDDTRAASADALAQVLAGQGRRAQAP